MALWMRGWWNAGVPLTPREENIAQLAHIYRLKLAADQGVLWSSWNPLDNAGAPNLIQRSYLVFAPLAQIAHSFNISVDSTYKFSALLGFVLSGLGMYQLLLTLKLSRPASLIGAVAYMLSPPHITLASDLLDFNFYWSIIPWLIYVYERYLTHGRPLFHGAILGTLFTTAYISGNTYFVTILPFLLVYIGLRFLVHRINLRTDLIFIIASLAFFVGSAAFILIPTSIEFPHLWISQEVTRKQIIDLPHLTDLLRLFIWRWQNHSPLAWDINSRYPDLGWYFGTLSVLFSFLAVINFRRYQRHLFPGLILLAAIVPLFILMRWEPFKFLALKFLTITPSLQSIFDRTYRLFLIPSFFLSLFSAFGIQSLLSRFPKSTPLLVPTILTLFLIDFSPLSTFFFTVPSGQIRPSAEITSALKPTNSANRFWASFPYVLHLPKYRYEYAAGFIPTNHIRSTYSYAALSPRYTSQLFERDLFGALETGSLSFNDVTRLLNDGAVEYILLAKQVHDYKPIIDQFINHSWQIAAQDDNYFLLRQAQPPNFIRISEQNATLIAFSRQNNLITTRLATPKPTLVTASESWYPGWQVTVDGQPAPLIKADSAFLGVHIPAGNHRIVFTYQSPAYYRLSRIISLITLLILALIVFRPSPHLALLFLSLTLSSLVFIGAETLARNKESIDLRSRPPVYVGNPILGFRLKPNYWGVHQALGKNNPLITVETTNQGFRDTQLYAIPKPAHTFRILMLGDSFIQGDEVPLEQTVSKILERRLRETYPNLNFEVINAAWRGSNTLQQYLWLKQEGLKFNPDLIILNFYPGNDIDEVSLFDIEFDSQNLAQKLNLKDTYVDEVGFLNRKTSSLKTRLCDNLALCSYYFRRLKNSPASTLFSLSNWETTKRHLLAIQQLTQQHQVKFLFTLIPAQDNPSYLPQILDFTRQHQFPTLDFLPEFKASSHQLYFPADPHWTPAGHRLAGQLILKALEDYGHLL